ncbi:MAG: RNA polymerase sigma factor [Planctomycetota bacterium]
MSDQSAAPARFATTRWSLVVSAGDPTDEGRDKALASLCENYWYPLYAYVRRRGRNAEDARELTQEFFVQLLDREWLQAADQERGRFRSFLLTAFKRFLSKERDRANAQKRGGGTRVFSLNVDAAEERYQREPADDRTPESIYERRWALTLLDHVLASLQTEYDERGKRELFDQLRVYIAGESKTATYADVAVALRMTEGAVKVAVHRLRQRYRELLVAEVAHTVEADGSVDDELKRLLAALRH